MTIRELCKQIELNPETEKHVLAFAETFDFQPVQPWLEDFRDLDKMKASHLALRDYLGEDPGNFKMLACMLKSSGDLYAWYQEKGISPEIYTATMKCFSRFLEEYRERTGEYQFDRAWWTTRQAGGHLFRIGELEYERTVRESRPIISIHIPSDADFSPEACDQSLGLAKLFFARHFPQEGGCPWICHSWLLAPELKSMLKPGSNILQFQERFQISVEGPGDLEFIEWAFHTYEKTFDKLPENTRLQRELKKFLLDGGILSDAIGVLAG